MSRKCTRLLIPVRLSQLLFRPRSGETAPVCVPFDLFNILAVLYRKLHSKNIGFETLVPPNTKETHSLKYLHQPERSGLLSSTLLFNRFQSSSAQTSGARFPSSVQRTLISTESNLSTSPRRCLRGFYFWSGEGGLFSFSFCARSMLWGRRRVYNIRNETTARWSLYIRWFLNKCFHLVLCVLFFLPPLMWARLRPRLPGL